MMNCRIRCTESLREHSDMVGEVLREVVKWVCTHKGGKPLSRIVKSNRSSNMKKTSFNISGHKARCLKPDSRRLG